MQPNITIKLNDDDFSGSNSDSGFYLDEIAKALDTWDSLEVDENNLDYEAEAVRYILDEFDFEEAYLNYLNDLKEEDFLSVDDRKAYAVQNLKLGAWLALERPELFKSTLEDFTEAEKEAVYNAEQTLSNLGTLAEKANDDARSELYNQWLNGDRSNDGILDMLSKHLTDRSGNVTFTEAKSLTEPSFLTIEFDRYEAIEFVEDETGEEISQKMHNDELAVLLKDAVIDNLERNASNNREKQKAELVKRREENARLKEYRKAQAEKAEANRIAKLKGMVKSETNEN